MVLILPLLHPRIVTEDAQLRLSLGTFAVFLEPGYMLEVLNLLDLFFLWGWVLVGLGAARIGYRRDRAEDHGPARPSSPW